MSFSEEKIRRIAKLRDDLGAEVEKRLEEIESLQMNIEVLDTVLKKSSFAKATSLVRQDAPETGEQHEVAPSEGQQDAPGPAPQDPPKDDSVQITGSDGTVIARARVMPEQISITLDDSVSLSADTTPFRSFFMGRIIEGMKKKDDSDADAGRLDRSSIIECTLDESGSLLRGITIKNYRTKERADELVNTAGWTLARMLENRE